MADKLTSATPEQDRLRQRQEEGEYTVGGFFYGDNPTDAESVAREVNRALDQMEAGDFEEMTDDDLD